MNAEMEQPHATWSIAAKALAEAAENLRSGNIRYARRLITDYEIWRTYNNWDSGDDSIVTARLDDACRVLKTASDIHSLAYFKVKQADSMYPLEMAA